jgi:hypothetical protein
MINWALGWTRQGELIDPHIHWDHLENPPQNPFKWPYQAPKIIDLDLLGTLNLSREMMFFNI